MKIRNICKFYLFITILQSLFLNAYAQDIVYTPLYNNTNFIKTIDFSKPVGEIEGSVSSTATGGIIYSIPIFTCPGTNGLEPSIALSYNSHATSGIAGYGWNITGLSAITRTGKNFYHNGSVTPVTFTIDDAFLLDGMRFNPVIGENGANGTVYAQESESFSKIVSTTNGLPNNPSSFLVTTKDGTIMEFGVTADSKIWKDGQVNNYIMMWRMNKITDINGNYIEFKYDNNERDSRVEQILYTGNLNTGLLPYNRIDFSYLKRADKNTLYDAGGSLTTQYLLSKIAINHTNDNNANEAVKTYRLNYGFDNVNSMLKEIEEFGGDENATSLNSTIFLYGEQASTNLTVETTVQFQGECISGDFNADGKTDILANTSYYDNFIKYSSGYKILLNPQSYDIFYEKVLPAGHVVSEDKKFANFMASDFNKDGRDDVLNLKTKFVTYPSGYSERKIEGITLELTTDIGSFSQQMPLPVNKTIHTSGNFFIPGDFDGDGNQDYITMLGSQTGNGNPTYYYGYICTPGGNIANTQINQFTVTPGIDWTAISIVTADKILPLDFDGDGKQEILVTKGLQTSILSINSQNNVYTASIILSTNEISSVDKIFLGDFNGDRKSDLLIKKPDGTWKILYSNGLTFNITSFNFNQTVVLNGNYADHKIIVADFDGDGKSDVLHSYHVNQSTNFSIYYSKGMNSSFYYEQTFYNGILGGGDLVTGDFNGDGRTDLLAKSYFDAAKIVYFKPNNQQRLLQKITTGHNVTTTITHELMTNSVFPQVYYRFLSLDNPLNQAPFNYIQLPMYLLSSISNPDGVGGNNTTEYRYRDAVMHRGGKGFLGFKQVIKWNNVVGNTSVTENEFNTQFAVPYTVRQSLMLTLTEQLLSETLITNSFQNFSTNILDKRYFQKIDRSLSIDYFNDKATESVNIYDNYGNIINNVLKIGISSGNTVYPTETVENSTTFSIHNTTVPAKADNITITKTRNGMPVVSATTSFTYTVNGLRSSETSFYGLPKAVTTFYGYNNFGNPISVTTTSSSSDVHNRYASTTYDTKGRFIIGTNKIGQAISQVESFLISSKFGAILQHTTSDCLISTNEYDGFGKLVNSIFPDGSTSTINYNWQTTDLYGSPNPDKLFYSYVHFSGGKPDTKTYMNKFGQEWRQETASMYGASASWHTMGTTYNNSGNVKTKTNLYFPAIPLGSSPPLPYTQPVEIPRITTYFYDEYHRVSKISNDLGDILYYYTPHGNGKNEIGIVNLANEISSQVIDETGKIVTTYDNGGRLDFSYDSRGNQVEVKRGNTTIINSVFDIYGKQISLTDINAGTVSYSYDAYGQLKKEIDALGNTHDIAYDDFGRIWFKIGGEGVTIYEYYHDVSSGCSNNKLSKVTGFNGVNKEYTFDALKRLSSEIQTIDGIASTKYYYYNSFSQVNKTIYPSGLSINQTYDASGYLKNVYHTNSDPNNVLFKNGWVDGEGKYLTYGLGVDKVTNNTYNRDFISSTITPGIRSLSYNFDLYTGNLMQRSNNLINQIENFSFDNLNRLNTVSQNNTIQSSTTYDVIIPQTFNSGSLGNIVTKTDAGYYKYKSNKINALAYIMNTPVPGQQSVNPAPNSRISFEPQEITYTPFLKVESIGMNSYIDGGHLEYIYGPDYQRVKSHQTFGRGNYETRYYFGDYEKQEKNWISKEIHYISGGNGLCAILIKEAGVLTTNIVYTDHLGSITTVTNFDGSNVIAEQNFDAWGRNRNPNNWNDYNNIPPVPTWLYRGYTGHEMLPEFSLINMNGRIYDPIIGRMLSPDKIIPNPYNSQGYNRYTYAYNNPLSFVDPDGNDPVTFAVVVGAVIGGYMGGVTANGGNFNPLKWSANARTLGYVVGGAVIGAFSGYVGGTVASSGLPFSNTVGIISSSFTNSISMNILSGGQVPASVSFGFASYNFQSGDVNYLGEKGNSTLENIGFVFGALANLQDLVAGVNGIKATYKAEKGSVPHARLEGEYVDANQNVSPVDVSVAHDPAPPGSYKYEGPSNLLDALDYARYWAVNIAPGKYMGPDNSLFSKITLNNVNGKWLSNMTSRIKAGTGKFGIGKLKYGTTLFGCQSHVAQALWGVGVPTLPINLFPSMLYAQLALRQMGIYASPYLINR
jgi:RHS repeat-associated protein